MEIVGEGRPLGERRRKNAKKGDESASGFHTRSAPDDIDHPLSAHDGRDPVDHALANLIRQKRLPST
jgi:hypothetical protein